ncbi:hypothetical protein ABH973_002890 [Bradyrhizobium ottawaense]|uniref:hypothetical protein n=1 Tax=Bradyrhizobium ottawaense TaxID=931866 RepID=UPI003518D89A
MRFLDDDARVVRLFAGVEIGVDAGAETIPDLALIARRGLDSGGRVARCMATTTASNSAFLSAK